MAHQAKLPPLQYGRRRDYSLHPNARSFHRDGVGRRILSAQHHCSRAILPQLHARCQIRSLLGALFRTSYIRKTAIARIPSPSADAAAARRFHTGCCARTAL